MVGLCKKSEQELLQESHCYMHILLIEKYFLVKSVCIFDSHASSFVLWTSAIFINILFEILRSKWNIDIEVRDYKISVEIVKITTEVFYYRGYYIASNASTFLNCQRKENGCVQALISCLKCKSRQKTQFVNLCVCVFISVFYKKFILINSGCLDQFWKFKSTKAFPKLDSKLLVLIQYGQLKSYDISLLRFTLPVPTLKANPRMSRTFTRNSIFLFFKNNM